MTPLAKMILLVLMSRSRSPVMTSRPKAHSHSLIGRSKGGQCDSSPAKKGSSLGRIKS